MVDGNLAYKLSQVKKEEKDYTFLPEKPKWTTVSLLDIVNNNYRFEAGAFNLEAKAAINKIKKNKWGYKAIIGENGLADAYRPGIIKREYSNKKNGIPMFTPTQITEIYPKPYKYLSKKQATKLNDWYLNEGDIVLTSSGTIGKCAYVSKTLAGKLFSQNMIRITNYEYLGYIYAFFITEYGQNLLTTNNYGAVIQHIDPNHLKNVIIPNPPNEIKKKIHELVVESYDLRDQSNELIDKAEKILYEELQLPPIEDLKPEYFDNTKDLRNWQTKLSELNYRLDASYHLPIVKAIIKHLEKSAKEIKRIGDNDISEKIILPGRFKRIYVDKENGVPFFGGKQLLELSPSNIKYLSINQHENRISNQLFLKENMIAVTCSGTIGKINIIPKHWENWTLNQHVMRIVPSKRIAGYIFAWLNTDYGHKLITRHVYGSVVDEIDNRHLSQVEIPILKNEAKQKKINDLVLKANDLRYQAYLKEQKAIRIVNEEVINATKNRMNIAAEGEIKYKKSNKS